MAPEDGLQLLAVTDGEGAVREPALLVRAEALHRQLRPQLPADYAARMHAVFANGGRLLLALQDGEPAGLALWRLIENTYEGRRLYVDDLVTDEARRSRGIGRALVDWLARHGQAMGCDVLALDSGVQRGRAHAFYFREGFVIPSFSFRKALK
jgi:GNAT superfamily N-acetyltransferase